MKQVDKNERPLLTPDFAGGPSSTVYGLQLWRTEGIAAGTALIAAPEEIVVCVREDPTVAVSTDAIFAQDGAVARVLCRIDCGVNDPKGLVSIAATTLAAAEGRAKK
jgi:HK97 family phage major capsid protein